MFRSSPLALLTVALVGTSTIAFAAKDMDNDAMAIAHAKIPLAQAITAAEQQVKGKAIRAEYEQSKSGWAYDVEVVSGPKVFDVKVNADNGSVISVSEDKADHDDHNDKED